MNRVLADVGNSRLKWGKLRAAHDGQGASGWDEVALPVGEFDGWMPVWEGWELDKDGPCEWAISSVNPKITGPLLDFLRDRGVTQIRQFRCGQDVPIRHEILHPETAGADRALGVLGALSLPGGAGRPGIVISCGSAITVDRIDSRGVWTGGAIAPGLALASDTLHLKTAQLPFVQVTQAPPAWGRSTVPAIEAGVFWGCVGTIRELVTRQGEGLDGDPWIVWTGGDARVLSDAVAFPTSRWVSSLVFLGLRAAVGW